MARGFDYCLGRVGCANAVSAPSRTVVAAVHLYAYYPLHSAEETSSADISFITFSLLSLSLSLSLYFSIYIGVRRVLYLTKR